MEKKPEMFRRSKMVKFIKQQTLAYEAIVKSNGGLVDNPYAYAISDMINKLCEEFSISMDEIQQ